MNIKGNKITLVDGLLVVKALKVPRTELKKLRQLPKLVDVSTLVFDP